MDLEKLTQQQVAELLGLTTRQIRNLETEKGLPSHSRRGKKHYVWGEVLAWDKQRREEEAAKAKPEKDETLWDAERRKAVADASMAELKEQQLRGTLISQEDAIAEVTRFCERVRSSILSVRSRHQAEILNLQTIADAGAALDRIAAAILTDLQASRGGALDTTDLELPADEPAGSATPES